MMIRQRPSSLLFLLASWLFSTIAHSETTERNLAIYALYNVPPFAVTFTTKPTDELQMALDESAALLSETGQQDSSLSYPIRSITESFLLDNLQTEIGNLQMNEDDRFVSIYDHLIAVEFQTKLYLNKIADDESSVRGRRRTAAEVTLVAEMFGTLAFVEPVDKSTKPSNEKVRALFGEFLDKIFATKRDQYLRELVQSEQELLREISSLEIETNIDQGSGHGSSYREGWSARTEKALLTMLILLGIMGLVWMVLYLRQRRKHKKLSQMYGDDDDDESFTRDMSWSAGSIPRPNSLVSRDRQGSMDAVRHGKDTFHRTSQTGALSVLENADRYLSKHRPDLHRQESAGSAEISVFGRNYSIPANPFEYIYTSFADQRQPVEPIHSPRSAFTPRGSEGRRNSIEIQKENIQSVQEALDESYDEEYLGRTHRQSGGYRPIATIWRNLSGMWEDVKTQQQQQPTDGLVFYSQEQQSDVEQEDPADYDFAFKDFPRHDGTPCLIYNDDDKEEQNRIFVIGSHDEDDQLPLDNEEVATTPVGNSAFQRMLSQQSLTASLDEVIFEDVPLKSPEFKEKLERLVQQKKRQYEKKSIVEKHREQRAKERKHIREQERRERHKAIEAEIESIEATFKSPLERSRAMQMSPKVSQTYSPKSTKTYSPMPARHYSPKRSPMRAKQETYRQAFSPYKMDDMNMGVKGHNSWGEGDRPGPSYRPSVNGGSVFRPAPKTSYSDNPDASSRSSRSISPPGGIEDSGSFSLRPRTSRPNPDLTINTSYGHSSMDSKTMDKLSMPPMVIGGPSTITGNPKYPSPQSVIDEILMSSPPQQTRKNNNSSHRRVNSYSDMYDETSSSRSHNLPPRTSNAKFTNHRRSNSQSGQDSQRNRAQQTHRRANSQASTHSDDVFLHGIFAQTRFV